MILIMLVLTFILTYNKNHASKGSCFIIPLKKGIMLLTKISGLSVCLSVCLCVCVCVCPHDCGEMAGLSNMVLHEGITYDNSSAQ